jgi:hypothetical protein
MKAQYDLISSRKATCDQYHNEMEFTNKSWQGILKLIITLSASFMVLTLTLIDRNYTRIEDLNIFSIVAWIMSFCSAIFGILQLLSDTIFYGSLARQKAILLKEYDSKIASGVASEVKDLPEDDYFIPAPINWGICAIVSFAMGIFCLNTAFLDKIFIPCVTYLIFFAELLLLIGLTVWFLGKYKKAYIETK